MTDGNDLDWNGLWELGYGELDAEHRHLFGLYTEIRDSLERGRAPNADLRSICTDLMASTRAHFQREEELMAAVDYPDRAVHRKLHQSFLDQVEDIWAFVREGDDPDDYLGRFLVLGFIGKWLKMHILAADRAFGAYLQAHPQPRL